MLLKPLKESEWKYADYRAFATIHQKTELVVKGHEHISDEYYEDGLGKVKVTRFLTPRGKQFSIVETLDTTFPITEIFILNDPHTVSDDFKEILEVLKLNQSDFHWINPDICL